MPNQRYPFGADELEAIAAGSDVPKAIVRMTLPYIPPEMRHQWSELLKTDSAAAVRMARDHGFNPVIFDKTNLARLRL
jgi:hypothetical protein